MCLIILDYKFTRNDEWKHGGDAPNALGWFVFVSPSLMWLHPASLSISLS